MNRKFLVRILTLSLFSAACNPAPQSPEPQPCTIPVVELRDPFDVSQQGLQEKNATHRYCRFEIRSAREYKALQDLGVILYDHDIHALPSLNGLHRTEHTDTYSVFYGTVPVSADLSAFHYQNLRSLILPSASATAKVYGEKTFSGQVTFFDPVDSTLKPLEGVEVLIRGGSVTASTHSAADGAFTFTTADIATDTVEVFLRFDNDRIEIHTLSLDDILGVRGINTYSMGYRQACAFSDLQLVVDNTVNSAALHHSCAMLLTFNQYQDFTTGNGFLFPDRKFLMWLGREAPISTSYAAPMLQHMAQEDVANPVQLLVNLFGFPEPLALSLANTLKSELPDIYAPFYNRYSRYARTSFIETLFHEFSHASHFAKVGPDFWLPYVEYIYGNGGYGNDSLPGSGIISMSESWAEDLSNIGLNYIYGNSRYLSLNENTDVNWIPYGLYYDVYDSGSNESYDAVSGIGFLQIYNQFTNETRSPEAIRERLKTAYPDQSVELDELFRRYGR